MEKYVEPIDGDEPPFVWLQTRVRVTTHSEDMDGVLMAIYGSRSNPAQFLLHDKHIDVPIWIPREAISSMHPLTDAIIEMDKQAAAQEEGQEFSDPIEPIDYEDEEPEEVDYDNDDDPWEQDYDEDDERQ